MLATTIAHFGSALRAAGWWRTVAILIFTTCVGIVAVCLPARPAEANSHCSPHYLEHPDAKPSLFGETTYFAGERVFFNLTFYCRTSTAHWARLRIRLDGDQGRTNLITAPSCVVLPRTQAQPLCITSITIPSDLRQGQFRIEWDISDSRNGHRWSYRYASTDLTLTVLGLVDLEVVHRIEEDESDCGTNILDGLLGRTPTTFYGRTTSDNLCYSIAFGIGAVLPDLGGAYQCFSDDCSAGDAVFILSTALPANKIKNLKSLKNLKNIDHLSVTRKFAGVVKDLTRYRLYKQASPRAQKKLRDLVDKVKQCTKRVAQTRLCIGHERELKTAIDLDGGGWQHTDIQIRSKHLSSTKRRPDFLVKNRNFRPARDCLGEVRDTNNLGAGYRKKVLSDAKGLRLKCAMLSAFEKSGGTSIKTIVKRFACEAKDAGISEVWVLYHPADGSKARMLKPAIPEAQCG